METDEVDTAAMDSVLSKLPIPETLNRLRTQIEEAGHRLVAFRKSWRMHLQRIREEAYTLKRQYPASLLPNAWASPEAASGAIHRLQAYDTLIDNRMKRLSTIYQGLPRTSSLNYIRFASARPLIGPEARSCQILSAISEAEFRVDETMELAEKLEKRVMGVLDVVEEAQKALARRVESPRFTLACVGVATVQFLQNMLERNAGMEDEERQDIEDICEEGMLSANWILQVTEGKINVLQWQMSMLGMRFPRQTLLVEYFGPLACIAGT